MQSQPPPPENSKATRISLSPQIPASKAANASTNLRSARTSSATCWGKEDLSIITKIWKDELRKHRGWSNGNGVLHDWMFFPGSLIKDQKLSQKEIKAKGVEGIHYADGWEGLGRMLTTYGVGHSPGSLEDLGEKVDNKYTLQDIYDQLFVEEYESPNSGSKRGVDDLGPGKAKKVKVALDKDDSVASIMPAFGVEGISMDKNVRTEKFESLKKELANLKKRLLDESATAESLKTQLNKTKAVCAANLRAEKQKLASHHLAEKQKLTSQHLAEKQKLASQHLTEKQKLKTELKELKDKHVTACSQYRTMEEEFKKVEAENKALKKAEGGDDANAERLSLRESLSEAVVKQTPNVKWCDVVGLNEAKNILKQTLILPIRFPHLFTDGGRPFKGILLYGPSGTGKSHLAKAVATEVDATFFSISSSDLVSKWQGESERLIRNLFEMARESPRSRAIIFIDEIDSLCGNRTDDEDASTRRIKTEFLVQMDGVGKSDCDVLVLGATNRPWELDSAIIRRFEKRVYIPLPNQEARSDIIKRHLQKTPNNLEAHDYKLLGEMTDGASGSDIVTLIKNAKLEPVQKCMDAQQFILVGGFLMPCKKYPNCPDCPPKLSSDPPDKDYTCQHCGAMRMQMMDIVPSEKLKAPLVELQDFKRVLENAFTTVPVDVLEEYKEWTSKFGKVGS